MLGFSGTASAKEHWYEAHSPHFRLIGNAKKRQIRDVAQSLEEIRVVIRAGLANPDLAEPTVPITIYVLSSEKDLQTLAPSAFTKGSSRTLSGVFLPTPFEGIACVVIQRFEDDVDSTVYSGLYTLYASRSEPWRPVWLRHGMSGMWGNAKLDGSTMEVGRMDEYALGWMQSHPLLPIETLLSITTRSPEYQRWDSFQTFSAQSELFTHFLVLGQKDGLAKLARFGTLVQQGVPQPQALEAAWGPTATLQKDFEGYLRQRAFPLLRAPVKEKPPTFGLEFTELASSRIAAIKAWGLAWGGRTADAQKYLDQALQQDGGDEVAFEAKALTAKDRHDRHEWYERAAAQPDASLRAAYEAALTAHLAPNGFPADMPAAEHELAKAIAIAPRFAPALARDALLLVATNGALAVQRATLATKESAGDPGYLVMAARVLRFTGHKADAGQVASQAAIRAIASGDPDTSNSVCWDGALAGLADSVFTACENAVHLAPEDANARDSRGLARALTGNRKGAIEDFEFFVAHADPGRKRGEIAQRRDWVNALKAGKNPFDAGTLGKLDQTFR